MTSRRYSISIIASVVVVYLMALNMFSSQDFEKLYLSLAPALFLFAVLISFGSIHRYLFKLIAAAAIVIASASLFFKWKYKATITEDILLSGMINDSGLTAELLSRNFLFWMLLTAIVPIWILSYIGVTKISFRRYTVSLFLVLASVGALFWMQGYKYREKGQIRDYKIVQAIGSFSPIDTLYAYKKALKARSTLKRKYKNVKKLSQQYSYKDNNESLLVVLVIGESTRGDHLSINGYKRETTPNLKKIKNLYSFTHARSCDTLTLNSVHYIFSPVKCSDRSRDISRSAFTEVLDSLGYDIEIYSLQTLNAFYHYLGYDKLVSKYAVVEEQTTGTKDISLLPYVDKSIAEYKQGKKLIIVHTLGSHQSYYDRIEKRYAKFIPACNHADITVCTKDALINSYDNTIVALDDFLSSIVSKLSNKRAMLVYLSDHGESLGENGYYFHGKPVEIAPKEQFNIPMIFWFSDSYSRSDQVDSFKKNIASMSIEAPISHDYLFHSMLGCLGVTSSDGGIDQHLNLCSKRE